MPILLNLNCEDREMIMLEKLEKQVSGKLFSWNGLNTLCWVIDSISGAMNESVEKLFIITVLVKVLELYDHFETAQDEFIIASNIMFVVGSYPRFLVNHWSFLKAILSKMFFFLHLKHPGIQDMACDTLLKETSSCKQKLLTPQIGDESQTPLILNLISKLPKIYNYIKFYLIMNQLLV